jgi:CRP-like cAMP-binding protein
VPVRAEDLAAAPLFDSLSADDLQELAGWFDSKTIGAGVCLAGEGAPGYSFFVLAEGSATVTADGAELGTLGPGDFFGEVAIIGDGRRSATVTTTSPSRVLVLFGTEFRQLQHSYPAVAVRLQAATQQRLATST